MFLYRELVKVFKWSLKDIDETNLETLVDFIMFKPSKNSNIRVIKGKTYQRAASAPSWL